MITNCKNCSKSFIQKHKRHCFCCNKCKQEYNDRNVPMKIVKCSNCCKEIERPRKTNNNNYFCSIKCESEFRVNQSKDIRECEICGKEIICRKGDKTRFCSMECQSTW
jgi:hypothetical protein